MILRFSVLLACGILPAILMPRDVDAQSAEEFSEALRMLDTAVLTDDSREHAVGMIQRDIRRRRDQANQKNRAEWQSIETREQWESWCDTRLKRLKKSLGTFPPRPERLPWQVTGVVEGDGFQIRNVVYESRPGDWVSANLYAPKKPSHAMPGLLIVHSHHRDKTHGELQDMGMTWARAGCLVLVMDQVGYGERRMHPFRSKEDYPHPFKSWRQDYYYRYDSGIQLSLAGDSLMAWFVQDLMCGVDLLLAQHGADPERIIILGSVAGGGDPCAITAAMDKRIAGAVPFNFGGLQPESYPLPANAEETFNFAMSSYWDSTRGLPRTCSDGFFHWTIVGSIAPRPLIYAHEFQWDRENDPVWRRFQRIYTDFYDQPDHLHFANGRGSVRDSSEHATHCTHIGRYHRQFIHAAFARWFDIAVSEDDEYSNRVDPEALASMTADFRTRMAPKRLLQVVSETGSANLRSARRTNRTLNADSRRETLRRQFARLLGPVEPPAFRVVSNDSDSSQSALIAVDRILLEIEADIFVPLLMLLPRGKESPPVVVAVSQSGRAALLKERTETVAELLRAGFAVCLPDVRGTGETREGSSRGRTSGDTNRSVNLQMFGETLAGQRLRDLRSVLDYLRERDDIDADALGIWGDANVEPNPANADFNIPHDVARPPRQPEPLGCLLGLLLALYDDEVDAVFINRGLASFHSVLESPHVYVPHDAVIPKMLTVGDVSDLVAAIAPVPCRLPEPVDALNRRIAHVSDLNKATGRTDQPYQLQAKAGKETARWFRNAMQLPPREKRGH